MSGTNWAARGKAAVAASGNNKATQPQRGEKGIAVVDGIEMKTFSTGSTGAVISYTVEGLKYPVREYLVFAKADGTQLFGRSKLIKRLQSFGLTSAQINKLPTAGEALGKALVGINGRAVGVFVGKEEKVGNDGNLKTYPKITGTFALDPDEGPNAA